MKTKKQISNLKKVAILIVLAVFAAACSTGTNQLTGEASKGPISTGTVTVYPLNDNGTRGTAIATATTGADGSYTADLGQYTGPVAVVITGGSYTDEATSTTVELGTGVELEALLASTAGGGSTAITALTTIAAARASENAADGLATAISNANNEVAEAFGLTGTDIAAVMPSDLTDTVTGDTNAQKAYGAVQSGLTQVAMDEGLTPAQVLDLVADMAADFEDGKFDGKDGAGDALETSLTITPAEAMTGLETAIQAFLLRDQYSSGLSWADLSITIPAVQ